MIIGSSSTPKQLVAVIIFGIIGTDRASEVVVAVAASTIVIIVRLSDGPTTADRHADAIRTPPLSATTLVPA